MIRVAIAVSLFVMLGASSCATTGEPRTVTQEVKTAVATSCVPKDFPHAPAYTDTAQALKAAPSHAERYQLLAGNHQIRVSRGDILEAVVDGCR